MKKPTKNKVNVLELLARHRAKPEEDKAIPAVVMRSMIQVNGYEVKPYWRRKPNAKR